MSIFRYFLIVTIGLVYSDPQPALARDVMALRGATMIDPSLDHSVEDAVIIIRDGRIEAAGPATSTPVPDGANIVDVTGRWITPGLIDAHVHFSQSGSLYTRPDGLDLRGVRSYQEDRATSTKELAITLRRYLASGVTSVVDAGGPASNFSIRNNASNYAPQVALAGPLLATLTPTFAERAARLDLGNDPMIIPVRDVEGARELVRAQLPYKPDLIKIWYIASQALPAQESFKTVAAIVEEAHKNGLRAAIHATELETARLAVQAGADILVHTVDDKLIDTTLIAALKERDVIVTSTAVGYEHFGQLRSREVVLTPIEKRLGDPVVISSWEEIPLENKSLQAADAINARVDTILTNLKRLADAGVRIAVGTDAGNPGTLHGPAIHRELELLEAAGLSPRQILRAATVGAANVYAKDPDFGTLTPGDRADLLVLRADPMEDVAAWQEIDTVVLGGVVLDPDALVSVSPAVLVQRQLEAYNAHDIDAFVKTYAEDVEVFSLPNPDAQSNGHAMLREIYTPLFAEQKPNCRALSRIVEGSFVIDQEFCRFGKDRVLRATAIYQIENRLIRRVWFAR